MNELTVVDLADASAETCGGKAATLGALLRAGLPVPDGFVVPFAAHEALGQEPPRLPDVLRRSVGTALARWGDPAVAVRSSAENEDTAGASAAGQYESVVGVRGTDAVVRAVGECWESASSARVADYWARAGSGAVARPRMAVLVQHMADADVSGVMFTPGGSGQATHIEASWGLGLSVVGGAVTPDAYQVEPDGTVRRSIGTKKTRIDRGADGVSSRGVPAHLRAAPTLDDASARRLAALGGRVAQLLGRPQDIEWSIADRTTWLLQARPVTVPLPRATLPRAPFDGSAADGRALNGTPGARGVATGTARVVRGPSDFGRVRAGDVVVCPYTDPAWTPLFAVVAGVVTQAGGVLSHAAIVAREYGIPAVLGVPRAMDLIPDGARVTVDGGRGAVDLH